MENRLLEFKNKLQETKDNENYNKELIAKKDLTTLLYGLKDTHSFYLCYRINYHQPMIRNITRELIILDEEDIKYFENKYLPGLNKEMEDKINKIKEEYGK